MTAAGEQCKVTATGTFRTNGAGGTVIYYWLRKDDSGTQAQPQQTLTIAKGDSSAHAVVTDRWTPTSSGSERLVFVGPTYPLVAQSFSCSG
ncbi:MAG TPA: hypothetical protein VGR77_08745 [Candidatus Dormibacteraeota bacterium]|nr:hypothetical protein [Candidatus Dormibacteraeota bacterium]